MGAEAPVQNGGLDRIVLPVCCLGWLAGAAYVEACEEENKGLISFTQGADGTKGMVLSCHDRQVVNPYVTPDSLWMLISV